MTGTDPWVPTRAWADVPGMDVPARWSLPSEGPLRLVVLGDSLAIVDGVGPQFPQAPHLYPQVAARVVATALDRPVEVAVVARPGVTSRELHHTLTRDVHVMFEVVMGADAVVVGVGSFDHAPFGMPRAVEAVVPHLRPAMLRARVRRSLRWLHPRVVAAGGSRHLRTAATEFERFYGGILTGVRGLTRGAPVVALGPTSHRSRHYGNVHPRHDEAVARQAAIAARHHVPTIAPWPLVAAHLEDLNPDGMHWPSVVHRAVGAEIGEALVARLTGAAPVPPPPSFVPAG